MRPDKTFRSILILLVTILSNFSYGSEYLSSDSSDIVALRKEIAFTQDSIKHILEEKPQLQNLLFQTIEETDKNILATEKNEETIQQSLEILAGLVAFCALTILVFFVLRSHQIKLVKDHKDQELKLKKMLSRLIPESLVEKLLHEEKVDPVMWKDCTIMFIELDELAPFESTKRRLEVIDHIFHVAENLFQEFDLQKIKTSGQQILVVCKKGRLTPVQQVEKTVQCAVKLRQVLSYVKNPALSIRVGVSYGDVISGLIGTDRVRFDIWGADVNIAYRNVQFAAPGKINISKYVMRSLNKSKHVVEDLGAVEIKEGQTLEMFAV